MNLENYVANKDKTPDAEIQEVGDKAVMEAGLESVSAEVATPAPAAAGSPDAAGKKPPVDITKLKVEKSCSRGLAGWLSSSRISLAITSYQTGRVYLVGSDKAGRVSFFERIFERAMGIVGNAQRMYLGGLYQLWRFENVLRRTRSSTASSTTATCRATPRPSVTWTSTSWASARTARWCSSTPSIPALPS